MDRHGDLGDPWDPAPRFVFVWENLLARLHPDKAAAEQRWMRLKRWERAFRCWDWDPLMRSVVEDCNWRRHLMTDVLITHPRPFADLVVEHLSEAHFEFSRVICRPLDEFERLLPHMPEVTTVFHGEAARPFLFGSRGQLVQRAGDVMLYG